MGTQFQNQTAIQVLDFRSIFPNLLRFTGNKNLQGCTALTKVTFGHKFTTMTELMFNTANLLVITGDEVNGSSWATIGYGAFTGTQDLVSFGVTPPSGSAPNCRAWYVPDDSVQAYKTKFSNISGRIKPLSDWHGDR